MRRSRRKTLNTNIDIDDEIKDTLILVTLRVANKHKRAFIKNLDSGYCNELVSILEMASIAVDTDMSFQEKSYQQELLKQVSDALSIQEKKRSTLVYPKTLNANIKKLSNCIGLSSTEENILKFCIVIKYYKEFRLAMELVGTELNTEQVVTMLSMAMNEPLESLKKALNSEGRLSKSGLLALESGSNSIERKLGIISETFVERMMSANDNIYSAIKGIVSATDDGSLDVDDYAHIADRIDVAASLLKKGTNGVGKGANILVYGPPGTGKTELAKAISKKIGSALYEIDYQDNYMNALSGQERLSAFKLAQTMFANHKNTLLLFDETEDVFDGSSDRIFYGGKIKQNNKAFANRMLEHATVPTVWLTNSVHYIDKAILRRFDMIFELPIPPKKKRYEIIQKEAKGGLDKETIELLSKSETLSPAIVARTLSVIDGIKDSLKEPSKTAKIMMNDMLKAQGYDEIESGDNASALPSFYDPSIISTNIDLSELAKGIEKAKAARICLYGVPGTGKSAYGRWLSEYLCKPLILKKGSDLLSMWVGGTEKNIKTAFQEAKDENAVLVFDEVDSFLADRKNASRSWEITQVNEMLTQMESFNGIFIATTNLIDNLDEASLRRFDAKVEFGYLKEAQALSLLTKCAKKLGIRLDAKAKDAIRAISSLTPGDFATVMRQHRFYKIKTASDFIGRLEAEVCAKKEHIGGFRVGFLR